MFVSAAFITHNNKLLLFHRDNKPNIKDPNCWDIIGGHSEENETPDTTLLREIQEEISIEPAKYKQIFDGLDVWNTQSFIYHVELSDSEVAKIKLGDEGREVKFFDWDELSQINLTQNLNLYREKYTQLIMNLLVDSR